jgi:hypothetical protein
MTAYPRNHTADDRIARAAQEAKAKRRAVLERVRTQRAQVHKRTVAEWQQVGAIIRGSELKRRYGF